MVNKLGMSKTQAQEVVQSTIGMIEPLKGKVQDVKEQSVDIAAATIKKLASAAWWMFVLAMLSLFATLGGGALGIPNEAVTTIERRTEMRKAHVGA